MHPKLPGEIAAYIIASINLLEPVVPGSCKACEMPMWITPPPFRPALRQYGELSICPLSSEEGLLLGILESGAERVSLTVHW